MLPKFNKCIQQNHDRKTDGQMILNQCESLQDNPWKAKWGKQVSIVDLRTNKDYKDQL